MLECQKNNMKILLKLLILSLLPLMLNSCSAFLGGIVALDNSVNSGEKEIKYEKVIELRKGSKIIMQLNDSTIVKGTYRDYKELEERNEVIKSIVIRDENDELISINTSDVCKYVYIDEGGDVWAAAAIGGVWDVIIIYGILKSPKLGGGVRIF